MQADIKEKIRQNLGDCNCEAATIEQFITLLSFGKKKQALAILSEYRKELLDQFHQCDERICCLDYLVNQIESGKYEADYDNR